MKIKLTAIIMAAMLFLSACGSNGDEEKVKIGLLRIDDSIPFYVAEQEGLFKEMGVEAELISFSRKHDYSAYFFTITHALCPPKPKVLLNAAFTVRF